MKTYLGILLIVLGTIILVLSYILDLVDYNAVQGVGLLAIIAGLVTHIVLSKKTPIK